MLDESESAIFDDNDYDRLARDLVGVNQLLGALISCGSEIEAYSIEVLQTVLGDWRDRASAACSEALKKRLSMRSETTAPPAI